MKVVFTAIVHVVPIPGTCLRVQSFGNIGLTLFAMRDGKNVKQLKIVVASDVLLLIVLQNVGHGFERLGRGKGPRLSAPPTTSRLQQEHRVVAFGRGRSVGSKEIVGIHQEFPSSFIPRVWQVERPRDIAMQLSAMRTTRMFAALIRQRVCLDDIAFFVLLIARGHRKEKLTLRVPKLRLNLILEAGSLPAILGGLVFFASEFSDSSERVGIGPHVGVERRAIGTIATQDVSGLSTVDVEFHAIIVTRLPKHLLLWHPVSPLPPFGVFDQVGQKIDNKRFIRVHLMRCPGGVGHPR